MSSDGTALFVVTISASPTQRVEDFAILGGAYVNVWVRATTKDEAIAKSQTEVRAAWWATDSIDTVRLVTREDYHDDVAGREHFEQALLDGIVMVFHTWPLGYEDERDLH